MIKIQLYFLVLLLLLFLVLILIFHASFTESAQSTCLLKSNLTQLTFYTYSNLTFRTCSSITALWWLFKGVIFCKWSENIKATDVSVILSFLFLFGSVSIIQQKEQDVLHLIGSVEIGKFLRTGITLCFQTLHVSTRFLQA